MPACPVQIRAHQFIFRLNFSVAKRKSLFDDKPVEIQELTYIIKQDIGSLNKQIAQLQEVGCSFTTIRYLTANIQNHR